ncbi:MAG: Rne/Rng family ribonuclease [Rhodospirillales bacterium]|nr:Rne/Rng family ribonuclease [Rhodospirillales bacterium]MBO6785834.1 Rne/Rng family ribonuclease [Rhodospirillales bacterium]
MATKRMLIDASHPEETRVVVLSGNRVEDFDVEVETRRQLKGNIYLAKVTRVEPSLQAAFVEYGGNRHGFLAFSEIHPDYYQIPVADREALIAEEEDAQRAAQEALENEEVDASVEEVGGGEDEIDEAEKIRRPVVDRRRYKIQEVIKRRQILLIQVVKEERGNKGAALTTYLSLAGRYCVLMPNTARGGGISRKIASGQDRKRLKSILSDLGIPDGMAVIVRTAGDKRTKAEIKRDYEYLIRLWEQIRQKTLESIAPCLIHEEGNLIKRSIRDIYSKDIDEVIVNGEEGYRTAKDFMKLMMPSHAKRVQPYKDSAIPLLQRFGVESQIDSMHQPEVQLKSGGYIVINSTEALVAIDVNSGRSTRERNIEETAYKTNLEAAEEVARQLRLRDLAGLIVIDFIDMENHRNQNKVERALKDAMRSDRARIQIGRISPFGLLEMSRQRLRPSLQEIQTEPCPHCGGTGIRRSTDTTALQMLRIIEEEAMRKRSTEITVWMPTSVALYILNHKRDMLARIEEDYELKVFLESDDSLIPPDYRMERVRTDGKTVEAQASDNAGDDDSDNEEGGRKRRRRRRGRRGRKDEDQTDQAAQSAEDQDDNDDNDDDEAADAQQASDSDDDNEEQPKRSRRRRRGRRAGRRRNRKDEDNAAEGQEADAANDGDEAGAEDDAADDSGDKADEVQPADAAAETPDEVEAGSGDDKKEDAKDEKPKRRSRARRTKKADAKTDKADKKDDADKAEPAADTEQPEPAAAESAPEQAESEKPADEKADRKPSNGSGGDTDNDDNTPEPVIEIAAEAEEDPTPQPTAKTTIIDVTQISEDEKPAKRGWWRRDT